jgi:chromosomal replication initiation ATPase DnaA
MSIFEPLPQCGCNRADCYFCWLKNRTYHTTSGKMLNEIIENHSCLVEILSDVSEASGVSVEQIAGESRLEEIRIARQVFCYAARQTGKWTDEHIGEAIGRDRTTVIHSCRQAETNIAVRDKYTMEVYEKVVSIFGGKLFRFVG